MLMKKSVVVSILRNKLRNSERALEDQSLLGCRSGTDHPWSGPGPLTPGSITDDASQRIHRMYSRRKEF